MTLRKAARRAAVAALLGLGAGLVTALPAAPAQAIPPWGVWGFYNSFEECAQVGEENTGTYWEVYRCTYDESTTQWTLWKFNLL
ncbi:hypothetical protein R8Z50_19270 [Longispora sp. K20-0274]|uniref:hypothetical protein n=1 Tax=Longispora sp. K20-0274 TaxID=3088255 RepID=UPI00399B1C8D